MKKLKKSLIFKIFITTLYMIISCLVTILYLYKTINLTNEEYLKLILNDSYGNNFLNSLVNIIYDKFNFMDFIEFENKTFNTPNVVNDNPLIFIYNKNQLQNYQIDYNIKPNVMVASYLLSNKLNNLDINNIVLDTNLENFSLNNNISIDKSLEIFINDVKVNYSSIKYFFDIGRSDYSRFKTTISFNNNKYAKINFYVSKKDFSFVYELNKELNKNINGISNIYIINEYINNVIKIEIGGSSNTIKEVSNTINILSNIIKENI